MLDSSYLSHDLNRAGLRATPQRLAIYRLLKTTETHPTAQQVFDELRPQFPSLSLATVYNTLEALVNLGLINALGAVGDDAIHYDADTTPHINLACIACHKVIDLPSQYVEPLAQEVGQRSGYKLLGARVLYYGLCPACAADQS